MRSLMEYFEKKESDEVLSGTINFSSGRPVMTKESMDWKLISGPNRLSKKFKFRTREALNNFITDVLEYENEIFHHGKITIAYKSVRIIVWTHGLEDITESDHNYARAVNNIFKDSNDS